MSRYSILEKQCAQWFETLDSLVITPLEYRQLLLDLASVQLPYNIFLEHVTAKFSSQCSVAEALCQLRLIVNADLPTIKRLSSDFTLNDQLPIQAKVRELFQAKIAKLPAITPRRHGDDVSDDMKNLRYLFKVPATLSSVKQIDEAGSADDDELPASGARLLAKLRDKLKIFAQQRKEGNDFLGSLQEEIRALITQCQRVGQFDLSDGDFTGLDLSKLNLTHMDFSNAIIAEVNFAHSNLCSATFQGRDRANRNSIQADFSGADCHQADFSNCDIRRSTFNEHTLVEDMTLTSSWLSRQNLQIFLPHGQAWKRNPNGRPLLSLNTVSFEGEDLSRLNLSGLYLQKV